MLKRYKLSNYDFRLVIYITIISVIGFLVIRSAANGDTATINRQLTGIIAGSVIMLGISLIPYDKVLRFAFVIYGACNAFLVAVVINGIFRNNARRWIKLPILGQIQPSEFCKIGIVLFMACLLYKYGDKINKAHYLFITLILAAIPLVLILIEPDLSTTIVLFIAIMCMIYVSGISYKWIVGTLIVLAPCVAIFFILLQNGMVPFLKEYQANRILAWLDREAYSSLNLQQNNSIMAIGSGQLVGKGLNNNTLASVKSGNFLSEEQTDFIFAVVGEEMGFVGCLVVIILYACIVYECMYLAHKARDMMGRLICTGIAAIVAFQSFCNIAVATGIFPNTGLPLPFISFGSSSPLSLYIGFGFVLNVGLLRRGNIRERGDFLL